MEEQSAENQVEPDNSEQEVQPQEVEAQSTATEQTESETSDWKDDLPESLKASKRLAKFKSKAELAQSYEELESKLGRSVEMPGKDAKPEDWDKFLNRIGRPKTPDAYTLGPVDGFTAPDSYFSGIKEIFHAAGLTERQADIIHKAIAMAAVENDGNSWENEKAEKEQASLDIKAKREYAENTLRNAWGLNYDIRLEQARRFVITEGGEQALAHLDEIGVGSDPIVLQLLSKAGATSSSHKFVTGQASKGQQPRPYDYMNGQSG